MSFFDFLKNKEKLEDGDIQKLQNDFDNIKKVQEEEKSMLKSEFNSKQEEWQKILNSEKAKNFELEKKRNELENIYEAEKLKNKKEVLLTSKLLSDGANPKLIDLFKKEIDVSKLEFSENGDFSNWEESVKTVKKQYDEFFVGVAEVGQDTIKPLGAKKEGKDPFIEGFNSNK